jgi:hypothetical protein
MNKAVMSILHKIVDVLRDKSVWLWYSVVRISKLSAAFYAAIYLLLIPTFALVYVRFPNDFYQSNAIYDEFYLDEIEVLESLIQAGLEERPLKKAVEFIGEWPHREFSIKVSYFEGEMESYYVQRFEFGELIRQRFERDYLVIRSIQQPYAYWHKSPVLNHNYIPDDLFVKYTDDAWLIPLFGGSIQKIYDLDKHAEGRVTMDWARAFYFSTVTITTLGYGDIVPTSNTVRMIISIESILGIILIGLFINAVAARREPLVQ